jgi:hypothetical protein
VPFHRRKELIPERWERADSHSILRNSGQRHSKRWWLVMQLILPDSPASDAMFSRWSLRLRHFDTLGEERGGTVEMSMWI